MGGGQKQRTSQRQRHRSYLPDVPPDGALSERRCHLRTGSTEQHHFRRVTVHHVEEQLRPHCHVTLKAENKHL